ncbi:hypothetical protein ACOMCU_01150 [Lysinibacillus sp. UGB7]|uniref:hypothetical protein n=1 Tax=Lysinibacillus sp. UGB7 TaxID=3411039 RepID=UPI003B8224EF
MKGHFCECGNKLKLIELKTYEQISEIKNNGTLSKRKRKPYLSHNQLADSTGDNSYLECWICEAKYEFLGVNEGGKVVKGEKFYCTF